MTYVHLIEAFGNLGGGQVQYLKTTNPLEPPYRTPSVFRPLVTAGFLKFPRQITLKSIRVSARSVHIFM